MAGPTTPARAGMGLAPVYAGNPIAASTAGIYGDGSSLGTALQQLLMADDIEPGSQPGYELCKIIHTLHPIGAKLSESPITMAQSQRRKITVQDAPQEVVEAFEKEWDAIQADAMIHDAGRLARIYGISSLVLGCDDVAASEPIKPEQLPDLPIWFNALDPLNTAGSLVLSQNPATRQFNTPVQVVSNGKSFHPSRFIVLMNERPIYLAWTNSAYGFVGRSVYQRALFPLKSFVRTMVADDMIQTKLGVLIAKQEQPGSIVNEPMRAVAWLKRTLLKIAQTGQVLSISPKEEIATLNMQNVDGAGQYSRDNILKNIATAADMPAAIVNNETFVGGFGEGTEDAKNIARYLEGIRMWLAPAYAWFDSIVQYRAWTPTLFKYLQSKHPAYRDKQYADVLSEWRASFSAQWPSLLEEPESERVKFDDVRLQASIALIQTAMPYLDPFNQVRLLQGAIENISENKLLFPHEYDFDWDALLDHLEQQLEQAKAATEEPQAEETGEARKFGRFDADRTADILGPLKQSIARLADRRSASAKR